MMVRESRKENYSFAALSEAGASHQDLSLPNQDSVAFAEADGDYVVVASDGVGSCKLAHVGSKAVVDACCHVFDALKCGSLSFDSKSVSQAILEKWRKLTVGLSEDDCCATLQAAFKLGSQLMFLSVGDGFWAYSSSSRQLVSECGEMAFLNETECLYSGLTAEGIRADIISLRNDDSYVVLCCTDGFANGIEEGKELDFLREIETDVDSEALASELESFMKMISKCSLDDKSVGVVKYGK
ncbi:MAG: protein phosphatase 2C domain-containing protein [Fibrobacter sp.]|nr:protein phosphatase 2C domain-containing protein [Fibrobacter sp.]